MSSSAKLLLLCSFFVFSEAQELQVVTESLTFEEALERETQLSRHLTINEVLEGSSRLGNSIFLLYEAPASVLLINNLAVIASSTDDTKLVPPTGGFKYLKYDWLHVALLQVATSLTDGFRYAHSSMVIIEQSLIDLPTLLTNTIRHTAKMKDRSRVAFAYKRINKRIERAAKTCHDVAINTTITFQQVLYEIDELQQATMGAESRNQVVVGQHKNTSIFLAQREASMREKLKDIERRYKEIQEDRKRALKEFQKQYDKTGKLGRMLAAAAIDLVSFIPQAFMTVYTGGAMAASGADKGDANKNTNDNPGSQSGSDPFDGMSNGNLNSESTMARLERIDKDKLSLANARLAEESAREKAQFDAMLKEKEAFAEVIAQLQSINLEVVNLEEVMKVLRQAVQHLGKIRNQWSQLADYFSTLKIVIETKLIGENLNELLEDNEQLAVTGFIEEFSLETSLRFIGYCIQIENSAKLYLSVSKDYIFPVLGRVGGQFGLSKSSAKAEQQHFASHYDKTMAGVKGLVDAEKKQLDARFERQIDIYWKSLKISQQKQITQLLNGTQLLN